MSVQLTLSTLPGRGEVKTATVSAQGYDTIGYHLPELQRQLGLTDFKAMICDGDQVMPESLVSAFLDQYGQLRATIMVVGGTPLPSAQPVVNFSSSQTGYVHPMPVPAAPLTAYSNNEYDERPAWEQNAIEMSPNPDSPPKTDIALPVTPDPSPPPYTGGNTFVRQVSTGAMAVHSHHVKAYNNCCANDICVMIGYNILCTVLMALWGVVLWGPMVLLQYPWWGIIVMFVLPFVAFFFGLGCSKQNNFSEEVVLMAGSIWLVGSIYAIIGGWYLEEYFYFLNGETFYNVDPHTESPRQYADAVDLEFVQGTFVDVNDWSSTYYITCDKDGCTTTWQCLAPIVTESVSNSDSQTPGNLVYPGNLNFWAFDYDCCNEGGLLDGAWACKKWDEIDMNGAPERAWHISDADEDRFNLLIDAYETYGATVSERFFINWGFNTELKWRRDVSLTFLVYLPATGALGLAAGWAVLGLIFAVLSACLSCIAFILCCPCIVMTKLDN